MPRRPSRRRVSLTVSYTDEKGEGENAVVSTSPGQAPRSPGSTVTLYVPSPKLTDAYH